mmetsp:Transcript_26372/g.38959  ORF Transcript_26372/g.38959 Transcript_26372/m.38959 type:complete len:1508 (+) Transcript_26372:66-4589(+)
MIRNHAACRFLSLSFYSIVISFLSQIQNPFSYVEALNSSISSPTIVRDLAFGDFAIINEAFKDFRLAIDIDEPIEINGGIFGTISVELENLICYDIFIGDILLSYVQPTETSVNFDINVVQFDTECEFDYTYDGRLGLRGEGSAVLLTNSNFFTIEALFSQIAVGTPPNDVALGNCVTSVNVTKSTFEGGIVASILNLNFLKERIGDIIANLVEEYICEEALVLDEKAVQLLSNLTALIDPYLQPFTGVDVLEPEEELYEKLGSTPNLINLLEPNGTIAFGLDFLLDQVTNALNLEINDEDSPTGLGKDLGVNVFIRSLLLDDDRSFSFNTSSIEQLKNGTTFETMAGNISDIEISIDSIRITGIDTCTRVGPIEKVSNYTVTGSFSWNYIEISAGVYVAFGPPYGDQKVEENILISTTIRDLDLSFGTLLGIKEDVGNIKIGDLTEIANILPCFLDNIEALNISSLNISLGSIDDIVIDDVESPGLARVLDSLFQGLYKLYDDEILIALPLLFQTVVRNRLNDLITSSISKSECTSVLKPSNNEIVDFRDFFLDPSKAIEYGGKGTSPYGDFGTFLRTTIDDVLHKTDAITGLPEINNIIASLLRIQSGVDGTIIFNTNLVDILGRLEVGNLDTTFSFQAENLRLENVDTMLNPIILIEPKEQSGQELFNEVGFGVTSRPLHVASKLLIEIETNGDRVRDEIEIAFDLVGARLSLTILANILASRFFSIPIVDIFEVNCWLATLPAPLLTEQGTRLGSAERSLGIVDTALLLEKLNLKIDCTNCTSAALLELSAFVQSEETSATFTRLTTSLFNFVTTLLDGEFIQTFFDRAVNLAPIKCQHSPTYDPEFKGFEFAPFEKVDVPDESISFLLFLSIMVLGALLLILIFRFLLRCFVRDQQRKWMKTTPSTHVLRIYENQKKEDEKIAYLNGNTYSMIRSRDVPLVVRYGIPVLLLSNIALFLSAHFNLGGAISVFIKFAGRDIVIKNLFQFSIAQSAVQLWEAGAIELAILLMVFSIIWPYTKQLMTLIAWLLPPRILSVKRRGSLFAWLDALAKWSSVDIFFLVVSLVAFNIKVESPDKILPEEFYIVDVLLVPLWGLYANLIAQVLSQLSSHVSIYYHRKALKNAMDRMERDQQQQRSRGAQDELNIRIPQLENETSTDNVEEPLHRHHFLKSPYRSERLSIRPWVNAFIAFSAFSLLALILIGSLLPSFSFEQLGIVGILIEFGLNSSEAKSNFGVFSIFKTLLQQGQTLGTTGDMIGMSVIAAFVLLTLVIVPVTQTCALTYQWFKSMNKVERGRVEYSIEILSAWQYVEVYIVAIMVSSWQLAPTSEYLINSYCGGLTDSFTSLVKNGVLSAEDAQCFKLRGSVEEGFFVLLAAVCVLAFFNTFVMKAALQQNYDAVAESQNRFLPHAHHLTATQHLATGETLDEVTKKINLVSVQFTDIFPCFLQSGLENDMHLDNAVRNEEVDDTEINNLNQNAIRKIVTNPAKKTSRPETNEDPSIEV